MSDINFHWVDVEDSPSGAVDFREGNLDVWSIKRGVFLTPKAATDLASSLLQWSSQNRQPIDEEDK